MQTSILSFQLFLVRLWEFYQELTYLSMVIGLRYFLKIMLFREGPIVGFALNQVKCMMITGYLEIPSLEDTTQFSIIKKSNMDLRQTLTAKRNL